MKAVTGWMSPDLPGLGKHGAYLSLLEKKGVPVNVGLSPGTVQFEPLQWDFVAEGLHKTSWN
jgi:hypothetical protein